MNKKEMKVIILAAGEGKRLRPYTNDRPKCMVEVDGVSLIDRQLSVLESEGLENIVIIGGYKSEMLKRAGLSLRINPRYSETNMVWTLFCAEDELVDEVIISYGDIVYSREILQSILNSKADISVIIDKEWESYWATRNENPLDDAETLKLKPDGKILEIGQRPKSLSEIEGQYIGLIKLSRKGIVQLKEIFKKAIGDARILGKPAENAYMTDLLQATIDYGYPVESVPVFGGWVEIDTVSDLKSETTLRRIKSIEKSM